MINSNKTFQGTYIFDKFRLIILLLIVILVFFSFTLYPWISLIFPFVPPLIIGAPFSIDGAISNFSITLLWVGFIVESTSTFPFGYYMGQNNEYRFGQIEGIVKTKIAAVIISDILIIYLIFKYFNTLIFIYLNNIHWVFCVSAILIPLTFIRSYYLIKKLINDYNDYIEINKNYIEWFDLYAEPEPDNENYFLKNPLKKGYNIHLYLDEIIHVIPIIEIEKEKIKFIKFNFNLKNGTKATIDLYKINQIPNGNEINKAIFSVLGNKVLEPTKG